MKFTDFRSRAVKEGLRYGEDRMVFLRELGQNARDAGARSISVASHVEDDHLIINFSDDGTGMSFAHARSFLFTLYASSKEGETRSAGRYGVGFWSVLLFSPDEILIESATEDGDGWAMVFDGALETQRRKDPSVREPGTRVSLKKRVDPQEGERVLIEVERALRRYCAHLRRSDKNATPLPVSFNGERIDRPFSVDGPCWMAFHAGSVEGAVGLGDKPKVELYSRGILVWSGTTLDELRYGAEQADDAPHPVGLAPVYILNGNELSVTMDRRAVVDDSALAKVRRVARRRMRELLGKYLDSVSPRPLGERLRDYLTGLVEELSLSGRLPLVIAVFATLLVLGVGAVFGPTLLEKVVDKGSGGGGNSASVQSDSSLSIPTALPAAPLGAARGFSGPMIDPLVRSAPLKFNYKPSVALDFRVTAAEQVHPGRGIIGDVPVPNRAAVVFECEVGCVEVEMELSAGAGLVSLPTPTGHKVLPQSILLNGAPVGTVMTTRRGETVFSLAAPSNGILKYTTGPHVGVLDSSRQESLLYLPKEMVLPEAYALVADRAGLDPSIERRVEAVRSFVEKTIKYDRREATVKGYRRYLESAPMRGWIEFVSTFGRGDCDVKNTLAVLLLRRAGMPSRLAVGYAGKGGAATSEMHAWIEYYDGAWIAADATGFGASDPVQVPVAVPETVVGEIPAVVPVEFPVETSVSETVPPKATWTTTSSEGGVIRKLAIVLALLAGVSGLVALLILLFTGRGNRQLNAAGGHDTKRRVAAKMLESALVQPEVWLKGSGLSTRKMLPLLGGERFMSLKEAVALGPRGALWFSSGRTGLARKAQVAGAKILDSSDDAFGEMVTALPSATNLDEISRLRPASTERMPPENRPVGDLVEEVNRLLALTGETAIRAIPCMGLLDSVCRDVNLTSLNLGRRSRLPVRFVAVSAVHPEVVRYSLGGLKNRPLFAFLLLETLLSRSELLRPGRDRLRRRAAGDVLEFAS